MVNSSNIDNSKNYKIMRSRTLPTTNQAFQRPDRIYRVKKKMKASFSHQMGFMGICHLIEKSKKIKRDFA